MVFNLQTLNIQKFNPESASETEWENLIARWQSYFAERNPGEPIPPQDMMRRNIEVGAQSTRQHFDIWLVYDETGESTIATCDILKITPVAEDYEAKKHIAFCDIYVLPEYRRQGIASGLLEFIANEARQDSKTSLEIWVSTESGDRFLNAKQAKKTLEMASNRLHLSDIDIALMEQWVEEGESGNPDTRLILTNALPEEHFIQGYADLLTHIFDQMPKDDASVFPEKITVDSIQERFEHQSQRNEQVITAFVVEPDGRISAMTDISYHPEMPHLIHQGLTGVHLDARGRGLGKWLKAEVVLEILQRYPDVKYIDTNNANVNAPMLHINEKMGFKFHKKNATYQLNVADILDK